MIVWRKRKASIKTEATIPSTSAILFLPTKENTHATRGRERKSNRNRRLLEIGKAEVVQHGRDVAIFGLGAMFEIAEEAARKLEEKGISVALINPRWIKPMDTGRLEFFARSVDVVCTIEDHVLHNGFGCAVMEHLHSRMINTPVVRAKGAFVSEKRPS